MKDEHKGAIEVSVIFHEGNRMFAVPKQPAPVQGPVAHINQNGVIHESGYEWGPTNMLTPLYTTPPAAEFVCSTGLCHYKEQRPWVGLTDEKKRQIFEREDYQGWLDYINTIEAKLKELNT